MRKTILWVISFFFTFPCACAHIRKFMSAENGREAFNLSINKDVKRAMKVACAESGEDVSEVTEKLYAVFLKQHAAGKTSRTKAKKR